MLERVVVACLSLGLSGCGIGLLKEGEPAFNTALLVPAGSAARDETGLHPSKGSADGVEVYCPAATETPESSQPKIKRCVYALKAIIDDHYREYRITLHHAANEGNAAADVANLGLTTAVVATPGAVAKTVLAAIAAGLSGSKSAINEDLFYGQAIEIVLNQMDADRSKQFSIMLAEMSSSSYTIEQAKDDLLLYFAYGTWDHALASLQASAAANSKNCQAQRDNTKLAAAAGNAGAATADATTTGTGCPTPAAIPVAPGKPGLKASGAVVDKTGGTYMLTVTLSGPADDQTTLTLDDVPLPHVTSVTVFGMRRGGETSVSFKKAEAPAAGRDGAVIFELENIKPAAIKNVITLTEVGKDADGLTTGLDTIAVRLE